MRRGEAGQDHVQSLDGVGRLDDDKEGRENSKDHEPGADGEDVAGELDEQHGEHNHGPEEEQLHGVHQQRGAAPAKDKKLLMSIGGLVHKEALLALWTATPQERRWSQQRGWDRPSVWPVLRWDQQRCHLRRVGQRRGARGRGDHVATDAHEVALHEARAQNLQLAPE